MNHIDNPFSTTYSETEDLQLIDKALNGSKDALEDLIRRHQDYIYNVALRMVLNPLDAEDLTQEVLVKVITKLSQFQGKSSFQTWLYRITFNHFLNTKKKRMEGAITTFEAYGQELDSIPTQSLSVEEQIEIAEQIEEAKLSCMSGMLLCLDRDQRLVYILGEIFAVEHHLGAELLEISKTNFRKRLERARRDLCNFMQQKCGLINHDNPCRCARKTKGFIVAGWVHPTHMRFNTDYVKRIEDVVQQKDSELHHLIDVDYQMLFQEHPFQEKHVVQQLHQSILANPKVQDIFELREQ